MKNRKNKIAIFLKFGILLFGIFLLLWRCDKEDTLIETPQIKQKTLIKKIENVSLNTISNSVKNTIIGIKTKNNYKNKGEKNIIYNYNDIVKTIDTLGNTKYSILFQVKNQPKNVLYNLITGIEKDKTPITPYVMKYTISNLKTNKTYDFGNFNGIIEKYAYNDFFKNINNQKYHHKGDNEPPLKPCLKSGVSGGGGGNNGNANGSFSDNLGNTNTGTSNISGFRSPFYSFSSGTGVSGLTPTSCISGLTTGPLSDPEVDDDDGGSSSDGGGDNSNDVVPPGCIDESTTTNHITKLIEDCYDTNSPINTKCIGKLLDENGNCVDIDPCDEIKNQISPSGANIKPILENLKTKINLPSEKGWSFMRTDAGYSNHKIAVSILDFKSVKPPIGANIYGAAHTHTDQLHGMFSWSDIHALYSLHENTSIHLKNSVFFYLVAQNSGSIEVYGITIDNFSILKTKLNNDIYEYIRSDPDLTDTSPASIEKAIKEINKKLGENYDSSTNLTKTFLENFKSHGIKLYKCNSDLTNVSEQKLNETTGSVEEIPCE